MPCALEQLLLLVLAHLLAALLDDAAHGCVYLRLESAGRDSRWRPVRQLGASGTDSPRWNRLVASILVSHHIDFFALSPLTYRKYDW